MASQIEAMLDRLAALPREWRVTTLYADGATRHHDTHTERQAENYAVGEYRKLGRELLSRETGKPVRVVDVTISAIGAA